jgi:hypothetical protein
MSKKDTKMNSFSNEMIEIPVDATFTSNNGCKVRLQGTADMTVRVPLRNSKLNSFVGTVTLSGPKECPQGTLVFTKSGSADIGVNINNNNLCDATNIQWNANVQNSKTNYAVSILNQTSNKATILSSLKSANCN